jgi:hypothetical protein
MLNILVILLIIPMYLNDIGINRIINGESCKTTTQVIPIQSLENNVKKTRDDQIFNLSNRGQILWQYPDASAIAKNVSITPDGKYIWAFQGLNNEKLQLFDINSNIPQWEISLNQFNDPHGIVDSWSGDSDTMLAASLYDGTIDSIYVYHPGSSTPVWAWGFPSGMGKRYLTFSGDGSYLTFAGYNSSSSQNYIISFNATTGDSLWAYTISGAGEIFALDASYDGNIILLVSRYNNYVFEGGTLRWSCTNTIKTCSGAMSSDGQIICWGDFHAYLYTYSWNGSIYQQKWSYYIPPTAGYYNWISSVDVSESGKTIVIGSLETISTGKAGRVAIFDSSSSTPLWEYLNCGHHVPSVAITPDGEVAIAGTWGDISNLCDDILVFEQDSGNPIFSYSSPGSIYMVDISDNGEYAVAGGKAVHANISGHGGYVYAIKTDHISGVKEVYAKNEDDLMFEVYPNISKNNFIIHYSLSNNSNKHFSLRICDISGRTIRTFSSSELSLDNSKHSIIWDGTDDLGRKVLPGSYFIQLITDEFSTVRKLLLIR